MKPATLSNSADFRRAYGEGRRSRRNGVGVAAVDRGDGCPTRVGYAVKKSTGTAVHRNRIKRRLRAAVTEIDLEPGFDIVVAGEHDVAVLNFQVLVDHVRSALVAAGAAR